MGMEETLLCDALDLVTHSVGMVSVPFGKEGEGESLLLLLIFRWGRKGSKQCEEP